jgi:DNA-binding transcriptional ArsR family regulator
VGEEPDVFTALADPTRRAILDELSDRDGQTLFELCTRLVTKHRLGSSRQAISQHLGVLEEAGLVKSRVRDGTNSTPRHLSPPCDHRPVADRSLRRRRP